MESAQTAKRHRRGWAWLREQDRAIIELAANGASHRTIAGAVGISPGTVTRRLAGIHDRLNAPLNRFLLQPDCPVPDEARRASLLHWLTGLSTRQVALSLGIAQSQVRAHLQYTRGLVRGLTVRTLSLT